MQEVWSTPIRITDFRFSTQQTNIRLVLDATGPIIYTAKELPNKIIINIKDAKLIGLLNKTWLYKTPISTVQSEQLSKDLLLTLNLRKPTKLQHFVLEAPYRLVLDFSAAETDSNLSSQPLQVVSQEIKEPAINESPVNITEALIDNANSKGSRDVIIVIDPGHGGKDPGAIGARGTYEKYVALAIAKELQSAINRAKGFRAVLTRNGDYFISLRERLGIAHRYKADMFIAVHADAYIHRYSHGASIFALSQRGATSEAARWLAEKENESELGHAISDKNALLRSVLIDLAQTATISASLEMGDVILRELTSITHLHSSRVEQAGFVVLKSPDIPSLLVETGFLSDPQEEMQLRDAKYQRKLAICLAMGITRYFIYRPPQGTYLAKIKKSRDNSK